MVLSVISDQLPGMALTSTFWRSQVEYSDERFGVNLQVSCSTMVWSELFNQLDRANFHPAFEKAKLNTVTTGLA